MARFAHYDGEAGAERSGARGRTLEPIWDADRGASALEQDDVAPSAGGVLPHAVLDADRAKPDTLVEREAGRVVGEDARKQRPDAGRFRCRDEGLEQLSADTLAASLGRDVDALPGDASSVGPI